MCATCGCGEVHGHDHPHEHEPRTLRLEQDLLAKNDRLAEENRAWLETRRIAAFNVMGAPGAGKTALLEALIARLAGDARVAVLEGDQDTDRDAERIRAAGAPVVQINTGAGCHLDAHMVHHGLDDLAPEDGSILFIENVGNLVCPALFDLGERAKVVVMSVTEGDDKPIKYPHMFRGADVLVLNKMDLLPHVDFDVDRAVGRARELAPALRTFLVSARTGDGLDELCAFIRGEGSSDAEESRLREEGERIDALLEELGSMVGPQAWQRIEEVLHRTVALYGAGLGRVLSYAAKAGANGRDLEARVCGDDLVSALLRLHGLHPRTAEERVRRALASIAAELAGHGLSVETLAVAEGHARVRVAGSGEADPRASASATALLERAVHEAAPELSHVHVEGLPEAPDRLVQISLGRPQAVTQEVVE